MKHSPVPMTTLYLFTTLKYCGVRGNQDGVAGSRDGSLICFKDKTRKRKSSRLPFFRVLFLILLRPLTLARPKVFFAGKFCSINKKHYLCNVK